MHQFKFCSFYVSDIHLVTMLLPYIREKMKEKKEFITIFETDIRESVKKVVKNVNLKRKEEMKLLDIGWDEKTNIEELNIKDKYILVMGSDIFMKRVNTKIEQKNVSCTIINCFEVFQGQKHIEAIIQNHEKVINSRGEIMIEEIFTKCTKSNNKKITMIE